MKKFISTIFISMLVATTFGQSFNLAKIVHDVYSKYPKYFGDKTFCYVKEPYINFIDSTSSDKVDKPQLIYFSNTNKFENYLKNVSSALVITVRIDKINGKLMDVTLQISEIDTQGYYSTPKIYSFFDARTIKLRFDNKRNKWIYNSLVKYSGEAKAREKI